MAIDAKLVEKVIEANTPLIEQETFEEQAYSIGISVLSPLCGLQAWHSDLNLSSCLFALCLLATFLLRRVNVLSIKHQIEINQKSILEGVDPAPNVYESIVGVLNWVVFGLFSLGVLTYFIH